MLRNGLYFIGIPRSGPTGDKRRVSRSLGRMGRLYGAVQKRGQKPLPVPALFRKGVSCAACCLERRDVKTGVGTCFLRERSGASCRRFFRTRERQRFECSGACRSYCRCAWPISTHFGSFCLRPRALRGRLESRWCLRGRWAGGPVRLPVFSSAAYDLLRECRTRFCLLCVV